MKNNDDLWSINDRPSKRNPQCWSKPPGMFYIPGIREADRAIIKFEIMLGYLNLRDKILEFILSETVVG